MGNNHLVSAQRRGKQANVLFGGREEKLATECVYLVKRSMYGIWCSMASAAGYPAVVGATVVGAAMVGAAAVGAAEVGVTGGVLYGAVVVGVVGGVLYGAAVV